MPSCCAHCFEESPLAMHCRTSRSRSDKATKSSCCLGKFTMHPLTGKQFDVALIGLVITALQQFECSVPESDRMLFTGALLRVFGRSGASITNNVFRFR